MDKLLTDEFMEVLNSFRKFAGHHHMKTHVHMGEFMMLGVIRKTLEESRKNDTGEPGIKVGELSKLMHATKPATSKMLSVIEAKGYIERVPDPGDRRVVYVRLSEKGDMVIKEAQEMLHSFAEQAIEKLGEEDARELIRLLRKFYHIITVELKGVMHNDKNCNRDGAGRAFSCYGGKEQ